MSMSNEQQNKAEARAALWEMSRALFHDEEYANATIDAFEAAVRAEALAPRDASPELAGAEARLRSVVADFEIGLEDAAVIAAELDRLRAALALEKRKVEALDRELVQPLRAEIARLTSSQRTVYVQEPDESEAIEAVLYGDASATPAAVHTGDVDGSIYAVHLRAERMP
jgi:hypothetical protein